jgi:hypothetical protein
MMFVLPDRDVVAMKAKGVAIPPGGAVVFIEGLVGIVRRTQARGLR